MVTRSVRPPRSHAPVLRPVRTESRWRSPANADTLPPISSVRNGSNKFGVIVVAGLSTLGCAFLYAPRTPQGVHVLPLSAIELDSDVESLLTVAALAPEDATHRHEFGVEFVGFRSPRRGAEAHVYRSIHIQRLATADAAFAKYEKDKATFSSEHFRLYEEGGRPGNRYFLAYKVPWTSTNHGIPVGVVTGPEILFQTQKRNVVAEVSYSSYRNDKLDYVPEIDADIAYLADLLRRSLVEK